MKSNETQQRCRNNMRAALEQMHDIPPMPANLNRRVMNNLPRRHHRWLWPLAAACVAELMIVASMLWQQADSKPVAQTEKPEKVVPAAHQQSVTARDTMPIEATTTEEPMLAKAQPTSVRQTASAEEHDTCPAYTMEELVVKMPHVTMDEVKVKTQPTEPQLSEHADTVHYLPEFRY